MRDFLPAPHALEQAVERERGLARTGVALDEVEPVGGEAAAEHIVESGDPCGEQGR